MADSIHLMIQLEEDHCHNHQDQKLPILDLKVWVVEVEEREEKRAKLRWQYYRKPMSNWLLIPANSALALSIKRTSLAQYGLRILRNTSLELSWNMKAEMLSEFSERMRDHPKYSDWLGQNGGGTGERGQTNQPTQTL